MKQARRLGVDPLPSSPSTGLAPAHIQGVVAPRMPQPSNNRPIAEVLREKGLLTDDAAPQSHLPSVVAGQGTPPESEPTTFHGENAVTPGAQIAELLPVDKIDPSPYQPRLIFSEDPLSSLADTISDQGLNNAIIVRPKTNGRYELIAGERRLRSVKLLRQTHILAVVRALSDSEAAILAATDNDAREDLTEFERGRSYRRLMDERHVQSQQELARRVGRSMSSISRCLSYFKLPTEAVEMLMKDPTLIGNKVVSEFVAFTDQGHAELVVKAIARLRDGKPRPSQEVVLNWLKGEVRRLDNPHAPTAPRSLHVAGKAIANVRVEGRKITLTCDKEISPELLLAAIERHLSQSAETLTPVPQ